MLRCHCSIPKVGQEVDTLRAKGFNGSFKHYMHSEAVEYGYEFARTIRSAALSATV